MEAVDFRPLEFSESRAAIAAALVEAAGKMGDIVKSKTAQIQSNAAKYSYTFADLATVLDAVQPAYQACGIAILQNPSSVIDERGTRITVETILLHSSGEWVRGVITMVPSKSDPQGVGSIITYARRYALQSLAGVAPEDDDGKAGSGVLEPPSETQLAAQEAARKSALRKRIGKIWEPIPPEVRETWFEREFGTIATADLDLPTLAKLASDSPKIVKKLIDDNEAKKLEQGTLL